ncbi:hypothetical protein SDC9_143240 [bioreactor metagenome]|uniref:Uncharacterized protein n=1 Tax=bioreactor metagenome TaxID=1076179 RepID=A0A645E5K5_9ZZZZ
MCIGVVENRHRYDAIHLAAEKHLHQISFFFNRLLGAGQEDVIVGFDGCFLNAPHHLTEERVG